MPEPRLFLFPFPFPPVAVSCGDDDGGLGPGVLSPPPLVPPPPSATGCGPAPAPPSFPPPPLLLRELRGVGVAAGGDGGAGARSGERSAFFLRDEEAGERYREAETVADRVPRGVTDPTTPAKGILDAMELQGDAFPHPNRGGAGKQTRARGKHGEDNRQAVKSRILRSCSTAGTASTVDRILVPDMYIPLALISWLKRRGYSTYGHGQGVEGEGEGEGGWIRREKNGDTYVRGGADGKEPFDIEYVCFICFITRLSPPIEAQVPREVGRFPGTQKSRA